MKIDEQKVNKLNKLNDENYGRCLKCKINEPLLCPIFIWYKFKKYICFSFIQFGYSFVSLCYFFFVALNSNCELFEWNTWHLDTDICCWILQ